MLKSLAQDADKRPVLIIGLTLADIEALGKPDGGGLVVDMAELIAPRMTEMPPELAVAPVGALRIALFTGRNDEELKTKITGTGL